MFISDKLIYVELHKTGCTHIRKILSKYLEGKITGRHDSPTLDMFLEKDQFFLGSIRCPWDWYVSLWAFGCMKKGEIYGGTTTMSPKLEKYRWSFQFYNDFIRYHLGYQKDINIQLINKLDRRKEWKKVYSNSKNPEYFRRWLRMINDPKYFGDFSYTLLPINQLIGLMTWRYLKFYCRSENLPQLTKSTSKAELLKFDSEECYINKFIRNESLTSDLIETLKNLGVDISTEEQSNLYETERSNQSQRRTSLAFYYDEPSIELVRNRESLIVEKFQYQYSY